MSDKLMASIQEAMQYAEDVTCTLKSGKQLTIKLQEVRWGGASPSEIKAWIVDDVSEPVTNTMEEAMQTADESAGIDFKADEITFVNADGSVASHMKNGPPLATIIDWRNEKVHYNDIIVNDNSDTLSYDDFKSNDLTLGKSGWNTVIRINFDAIPKQPTMTKEEAEKKLGVRIVG